MIIGAPRIITCGVDTMPEQECYIVKTKHGKEFKFDTLEEAEKEAAAKSKRLKKKQSCCSIYKGDNYICGYIEGKKLRQWKTLYTGKREKEEGYYKFEVSDVGVRFQSFSLHPQYNRDGELHKRIWKADVSYSFLDDGKAYVWRRRGMVTNSRFSIGDLPFEVFYDEMLFNAVKQELVKRKPELSYLLEQIHYEDFKSEEWICERTTVRALMIVYCRPNALFKIDTYKNTVQPRRHIAEHLPSLMWYFPTNIVDESKLIEAIAERAKIPCTKYFKRLYLANPENIFLIQKIIKLGFKNIDNVMSIETKYHSEKCYCLDGACSSICKKIIKARGERWVIKNCDFEWLSDVQRMIHHGHIEKEIVDYIINNAKNEEEIHNTVIDVYNHHSKGIENIPFKYSKNIKEYARNYENNIRFILPSGSKELAVIGATMGICVGSYSDAVIKKTCTIVVLMDGDKYAACIEVRKKKVVQLKAKFNNYVKAEYKQYLDNWANELGIKFETYDYKLIGTSWDSTNDYHRVNPHDFDKEDKPWKLHIVKERQVAPFPF